jgi:D-arginine dehydrogenase
VAQSFDVAVVGAGIVGASAAMALGATHRVLLLEGDSQPGYHTTGRSAAVFEEAYGPAAIRKLANGSRAFLADPPPGFSEHPLLKPRGVVFAAAAAASASIDKALVDALPGTVVEIERREAVALCPALDADWLDRALYEKGAMDMDVAAIHRGYLRKFAAAGGTIVCNAAVSGLKRAGSSWRIATEAGDFEAAHIVNAAGAWADVIAALAGAASIDIEPRRRTALVFAAPADAGPTHAWPMVCEIDEAFYFKPDAGLLLASPADETPSPPCDAQAEEIDVATCIDRLETATRLRVAAVKRKWAGLRCFVADRRPVLGPDPAIPGFHWAAALGGYGIMTSPATGRIVAAGVRGEDLPADLIAAGFAWADFSPARLSR